MNEKTRIGPTRYENRNRQLHVDRGLRFVDGGTSEWDKRGVWGKCAERSALGIRREEKSRNRRQENKSFLAAGSLNVVSVCMT